MRSTSAMKLMITLVAAVVGGLSAGGPAVASADPDIQALSNIISAKRMRVERPDVIRLAFDALADLRDAKALPILIDNIGYPETDSRVGHRGEAELPPVLSEDGGMLGNGGCTRTSAAFPAVQALEAYGEAAVPLLLVQLGENVDSVTINACLDALVEIAGRDRAEELLKKPAATGQSPERLERLELAVKMLPLIGPIVRQPGPKAPSLDKGQPGAVTWGPAVAGLKFGVRLVTEGGYGSDGQTYVDYVLMNVGSQPVSLPLQGVMRDYLVIVTDSRGRPVELTAAGEAIKRGRESVSSHAFDHEITLKPGESTFSRDTLDYYFNLSAGGMFTVSVVRFAPLKVLGVELKDKLTSTTLTFVSKRGTMGGYLY